jgi:hypothetical protein
LASRCARVLTGWNATATSAVATIDSARFGRPLDPANEPMPTTSST